MFLESRMAKLVKAYRINGVQCEICHPDIDTFGNFRGKHDSDYYFFHKNKFYLIDAKETRGDTWPFSSNLKKHQYDAMMRTVNNGGVGGYIILWIDRKENSGKLTWLSVEEALSIKNAGRQHAKYNDCQVMKLDFLGIL